MTDWVSTYRGTPYQKRGATRCGLDCRGLGVLVYREVLGIEIEGCAEQVSEEEREDAERYMRGELESSRWDEVELGHEREFDVLWFREMQDLRPTHIGLVISPGLMLHAHASSGMVVPDRYSQPPWSRLLLGIRRHEKMRDRA